MAEAQEKDQAHAGDGSERRHFGRIRQEEMRCNLGRVLDVSCGGVRIFTHRRLKGRQRISLVNDTQTMLMLSASVAWCKRLGFREYAVGLQFVDMSADQMRCLSELVHFSMGSLGLVGKHSITSEPVAQLVQESRTAPPEHRRRRHTPSPFVLGVFLIPLGAMFYVVDLPQNLKQWPPLDHPLASTVIAGICLAAGGLVLLIEMLRAFLSMCQTIGRRLRRKQPRLLNELHTLRHLLRCVLDSSLSGVLVLKAVRDRSHQLLDFEIQLASTAVEHLLGESETQLMSRRFSEVAHWFGDSELPKKLGGVLDTGVPYQESRWWQRHNRWLQLTAVKMQDSLTLSFTDITEQKQNETHMQHEAYHDALTGLPNRKCFIEKLDRTMVNSKRRKSKFAVLFLDFDGFKVINDSLGHEAGDALLISIAERIRSVLGDRDTHQKGRWLSLPARLGGDEFVVLMEDIESETDAERMAQRLVAEFTAPHKIVGKNVTSTTSVGIVTSESGHHNPQDVLRDADTAMYQAKKAGKGCYRMFNRQMHDLAVHQLNFERDLREALAREQFEVQYEPVISVESSEVIGVEALLRWRHPQEGLLLPGTFIGYAEQLNLIQSIGGWVLRRACRDLGRWRNEYPDRRNMFVSVNLSRRQLLDPSLLSNIKAGLAENKLPAKCLWLEVTEDVIAQDLDQVASVLHEIKALGVHLAMDDFGTGYSSLHCLHMLPFDVIKIDQQLVNGQWKNKRHYAGILHAVLELAHNLGLSVVAEGVESMDQLTMLQGLACHHAQGWLFSKSVTAEGIRQLLALKDPAQLQSMLWEKGDTSAQAAA
ncbi:MAG: EAL domain-containing protein [Phycisphaeraceae bacterium]|nr:EAL domain-containing protein [Phycisphaeraceae bacterium]